MNTLNSMTGMTGTSSATGASSKISIRHLHKSFQVGGAPRKVLHNINIDIQAGEFICFLGPSGCGKSTILNILSGLDTDYEGVILIDGKPLNSGDYHMSYLFQEPRLLPWLTVEKNIHFALDANRVPVSEWEERTTKYLEMVNLPHVRKHYIHQLSGGMQHRVAIARAFAVKPDILLMDEPFSALDELTARSLRQSLLKMWQEDRKTVLFVTHNSMEATYLADPIFMMKANPGEIEETKEIRLERPRDYDSEELFQENRAVVTRFLEIIGRDAI